MQVDFLISFLYIEDFLITTFLEENRKKVLLEMHYSRWRTGSLKHTVPSWMCTLQRVH